MSDVNGHGSAAGGDDSGQDHARDIATLSFEEAQAELEAIVEQLEDQHTGLDQALALWERGEALHAYCQARLDAAAARIEKLQVTPEEAAAVAAESRGDDFATQPAPAPAAAPAAREPQVTSPPVEPAPPADPDPAPMPAPPAAESPGQSSIF